MTITRKPILVVLDDDRRFVDDVVARLAGEYDVRTTDSPAEALGVAREGVDAALLNESLSEPLREELLATLSEQEGEPFVAFLPGEVTPSTEAFRSAVTSASETFRSKGPRGAIVRLLRQRWYDRLVEQFYSTARERARITQSRTEDREMRQRHGTSGERENGIGTQLNELVSRFDDEDFVGAFRRIATGGDR